MKRKYKIKKEQVIARGKVVQTYAKRNDIILSMGFSSYTEYLASALWADIRYKVLLRDNHECRLCNNTASVVHHIGYGKETMLGNNLFPIVSLCRRCHELIEFDADGKKRTLERSQRMYNLLWKRVSRRVPGVKHRIKK